MNIEYLLSIILGVILVIGGFFFMITQQNFELGVILFFVGCTGLAFGLALGIDWDNLLGRKEDDN